MDIPTIIVTATIIMIITGIITMIDGVQTPLALSRLLQLASPMLPVGAYSYSQGLEAAIDAGTVHDAATTSAWVGDVLAFYLGRFELPLLWRMCEAMAADEDASPWNAMYCAGRDTSESRAETLQMGYSLTRLLRDLGCFSPDAISMLTADDSISFPYAFAWAANAWSISAAATVQAYAWSWLENQVAAAMKAVPIGQVAGQRILLERGAALPDVVAAARLLPHDDISNFAPGLTLAGCRHEVQYSRLFRS